mgnify:FL=1
MIFTKVCGITNSKDALASVHSGASALGFIFYPGSKRFIEPKTAKEIIEKLPKKVFKVGVFVNQKKQEIVDLIDELALDAIQLHGDESPEYIINFKCFVIKAIRVKSSQSIRNLNKYKADAFLFDTYSKYQFGGTGKVFQWELLNRLSDYKTILSGGLNINNISDAIKRINPNGIDVNSGVELFPGKKDKQKIANFFKKLKTIDEARSSEGLSLI